MTESESAESQASAPDPGAPESPTEPVAPDPPGETAVALTLRARAARVGAALLCLLFAMTLASLMGHDYALCDLIAHMRLHIALGAALCCLPLVWLPQNRALLLGLGLGIVLYNVYPATPYLNPGAKVRYTDAIAPQPQPLKIVYFNLLTHNEHRSSVREWLRAQNADIIACLETDPEWMRTLEPLRNSHPYVASETRLDNFGITIFSRYRIDGVGKMMLGNYFVPSYLLRLDINGAMIIVTVIHTVPPMTYEGFADRNKYLADLHQALSRQPEPLILVGDLNVTPWSVHFRKFIKKNNLIDARRGFGLLPSWPTTLPAFLRIPIDHCLVRNDGRVGVQDIRLGPATLGSDHCPLILELTIPSETPVHTSPVPQPDSPQPAPASANTSA